MFSSVMSQLYVFNICLDFKCRILVRPLLGIAISVKRNVKIIFRTVHAFMEIESLDCFSGA